MYASDPGPANPKGLLYILAVQGVPWEVHGSRTAIYRMHGKGMHIPLPQLPVLNARLFSD